MTIVVGVKVRDGLALVTDSMTTVQRFVGGPNNTQQLRWVKGYPNTQKLYQLRGLPIGAVIWGANIIGLKTIRGLFADFNSRPAGAAEARTVGAVAGQLCDFFRQAYDTWYGDVEPGRRQEFGVMLGGYSPGAVFPELWSFVFPLQEKPVLVRGEGMVGANWAGYQLPIDRLFYALDPRLRSVLTRSEVAPEVIDRVIQTLRGHAMQVQFDSMPLQDALDFAGYLVETTIGYANFDAGAPVCGGPIQAAAIDRERGFQWVSRPELTIPSSTSRNRRDGPRRPVRRIP